MNPKLFLPIIAFAATLCSTADAGNVITQLGTQGTGLVDGGLYGIGTYTGAQNGDADPYGVNPSGADAGSNPTDFSVTDTFSYSAITDDILSATIMLGIYEHDSAAVGDQVASFVLDGVDFTSAMNTVFNTPGTGETPGFGQIEYNIYSLSFTDSTLLANLADGSASYTLTLQNGFIFDPNTYSAANGAYLDFIKLDIATRDSNPVVPEPASILMFGMGGLGLLGFRRRRETRQAVV